MLFDFDKKKWGRIDSAGLEWLSLLVVEFGVYVLHPSGSTASRE
jgi:hypothetical protein